MDEINSPGTSKVSCTYRTHRFGLTKKQFQCTEKQKCCGPKCCDIETVNMLLVYLGIALLVIGLIIVCWFIQRRKRKRDILAKQQQRVLNMTAAVQGPKECVVSLQGDDAGKSSGQSVKAAVLPKNFSFTQALFPPPNSKIEKCLPNSNDQQPLLDDSHWDGKPASVISESQMKA